jgi:hypothetical protein
MFMTAGNGRSREACDGVNLDRGRDVPFVASEAEGGEEALSDPRYPRSPRVNISRSPRVIAPVPPV